MFNAAQSEADRKKIRALPWHLVHGTLTSIFFLWTFGGSVFVLFLNELGLPKGQIGLMLSFFPFSGLLALVFAPYATRIGRKRVFITCFGARYLVIINLLLLPWILTNLGRAAGVAFVFAIMLIVAVLRALGETAYYPWTQEFIPNDIRGIYSAISTSLSTLGSAAALFVAGKVLASGTGLERYLWLIGVGTLIGLVGNFAMLRVPGGAPNSIEAEPSSHLANMAEALRNPNLAAYLRGMGGVMVGSVLLTSFLPLYLKEQIGLADGTVVTLDTVVMVAGALSSILWGWAADRVGSRPVLMSALGIGLLLPLGWLFLPRHISSPIIWCGLFYFLYGVIANGSSIGAGRLLLNGVIPQEKSTAYTALYYAWMGLTGGIAPLFAGWILSFSAGVQIRLGALLFDGHSLLSLLALILLIYGLAEYRKVVPDNVYSTRAVMRKILHMERMRSSK